MATKCPTIVRQIVLRVAALLAERPFKAMLQTVKKPLARSLQGASFLAPNTSIPHFDLISPQLARENTFGRRRSVTGRNFGIIRPL